MEEENVILVNHNDEQIGLMPKMEAHQKAVLHRAFSVFILNDKNEIMLQQRANQKYHSPLLLFFSKRSTGCRLLTKEELSTAPEDPPSSL